MHILFEAILNTKLLRSKELLRDTLFHIKTSDVISTVVFLLISYLITPMTLEEMSPHWVRGIPETRRYPRHRGNVLSQLQCFTNRSKPPAAVTVCVVMQTFRSRKSRLYRFRDLNRTGEHPGRRENTASWRSCRRRGIYILSAWTAAPYRWSPARPPLFFFFPPVASLKRH